MQQYLLVSKVTQYLSFNWQSVSSTHTLSFWLAQVKQRSVSTDKKTVRIKMQAFTFFNIIQRLWQFLNLEKSVQVYHLSNQKAIIIIPIILLRLLLLLLIIIISVITIIIITLIKNKYKILHHLKSCSPWVLHSRSSSRRSVRNWTFMLAGGMCKNISPCAFILTQWHALPCVWYSSNSAFTKNVLPRTMRNCFLFFLADEQGAVLQEDKQF